MGENLACRLLDQLPEVPLSRQVAFGTLGLAVALPELNVRVSDGVRLQPWLAGQLVPAKTHTYLQAFQLQDAVWVSAQHADGGTPARPHAAAGARLLGRYSFRSHPLRKTGFT